LEHNKMNQRILRHTGGAFSQAVIEGEVALPVGKPEMARLLFVRGRAETGSVESLDQRAMTDGTLTLCVCYLDSEEQLNAFESVSNFKHTADVPGAQAGMRGTATADVSEIETTLTDGRRINISAVIDIFFSIQDEVDFSYLMPSSDDGMMYKTKKLPLEKRCARATTAAEISGETQIPQGQPGVMQVLDCQGQAVATQAFAEDDLLCVEGELKAAVTYATNNPQTPIAQSFLQIPFSEMLPAPGAAEDQLVTAALKVKDLYASGSEDGGEIRVHAVCAVELEARQSMEIEAVEDAYALACPSQVMPKPVQIGRCAATYAGVEAVRESTAMPDAGNMAQILAVFATPSAARAAAGDGTVRIESVISCQIVYTDREGRMRSETMQWPISMEQPASACTPESLPAAQVFAEQSQAMMTSEGVDVRVLLNWQVKILQTSETAIADRIELMEEQSVSGPSGIIVYFTSEGDMLWDIAKRYRLTMEEVLRHNQEASEPFGQGERLVLMCRHIG